MILGALQQYFEVFGGASVASGAFLLIREDYQIDNQYYLGIFLNLGGRMVWKKPIPKCKFDQQIRYFWCTWSIYGRKKLTRDKRFWILWTCGVLGKISEFDGRKSHMQCMNAYSFSSVWSGLSLTPLVHEHWILKKIVVYMAKVIHLQIFVLISALLE